MNFLVTFTLVLCCLWFTSCLDHQWHKKLTKRDLSNIFQESKHDNVGQYKIGTIYENGQSSDGDDFDKIITIEITQTKYVIGLKKNVDLVHSNLETYKHLTDCIYQGRVLSPSHGIVSLSNCERNGYRGYIRTPEKTFQIDNIPKYAIDNAQSVPENGLLHFVIESKPSAGHEDFEVIRQKRQADRKPRLYELSLELHESFTGGVATALSYVNDAQSLYLLQSLGQDMRIFISNLRTRMKISGPTVSDYLYRFCFRRQSLIGDGSLLLMGQSALEDTSIVGVAIFGYVCRARLLSCGLLIEVGSKTDIVLAHELGHTFGMDHDESASTTCNIRGIMSNSVSAASRAWSNCSIAAYAAQPERCLMNLPPPDCSYMLDELYGEMTFDELCEKHLPGSSPVAPSTCKKITCSDGVTTRPFLPYNGTRCSDDDSPVQVCDKGNCVDISTVVGPGARKRRSVPENVSGNVIADCMPHWQSIIKSRCDCTTGMQAYHVWCYELCEHCYLVIPKKRCDPATIPPTMLPCSCS